MISENTLQNIAYKISKQAEFIIDDLNRVEDSCFLYNVEFTHRDIKFLISKIGDYACYFAKDLDTESEDIVEMRLYLQNMLRYITNIQILLDELEDACLDEHNQNIYPNIKEKIDSVGNDIEWLDQNYA